MVRTIATHLDYGPEILYRTPDRVLGTTYHRNSEGLLAGFAILGGTDLAQVRSLIQTRGVDLILVCPLHSRIYGTKSAGDEARLSLHDLLLEGNELDWLERVPVPEEVAGAFRLFRVTPSQWSDQSAPHHGQGRPLAIRGPSKEPLRGG